MRQEALDQPLTWQRLAIRAMAWAAVAFYVTSAHLTRGHEADFGKQWLAARLVATGQGTRLFDAAAQRAELERHFTSEVIERGIWRDGIGGPTYPPTLALAFSPLGLLPPRWAQWLVVQLSVLLVLLAAKQFRAITAGRVTWESAALATLCLPSFFLAVGVGQNSALSLAILLVGWSLLARDHAVLAGAVWGLFSLKPTWGVAVSWVPWVVGRPRAYAGMAASSCALLALTLPVCGVQAWLDWLAVARQTEHFYETLPRWTALSRDVPGLLRRIEPGIGVEFAGWASLAVVLGVTAWTWRAACPRATLRAAEPRVVALLAGSLLTCPRFMFYDMTLAVVPFVVAFAGWPRLRRAARLLLVCLACLLWGGTALSYVSSAMLGPPLDTFALVGLWLWAIVASRWGSDCRRTRQDAECSATSTEQELVAELA